MWRSHDSRGAVVLAFVLASLLTLAGCRDRAAEDAAAADAAEGDAEPGAIGAPVPAATGASGAERADTEALAGLLERAAAADPVPDPERRALEAAMQRMVAPLAGACPGCEVAVAYVDEPGRGDYFRCELRSSGGEAIADLHVFHRPALPLEAVEGWGRTLLAGHPASAAAGERLFVWPGRVEIRAFARSDRLGGDRSLEELIGRLPLDALARL